MSSKSAQFAFLLPPLQVFDEHLLDRLVVGAQHVADAVAAYQMANFFRQVLGVVARALQGLSHEQHMEALLAGSAIVVFNMSHENEVAQAIEFRIGPQYRQRAIEIALPESIVHVSEHFFQPRRHYREMADVLQLDAATYGGGAIAAVQQEVADALQVDDELEARQQFAGSSSSTLVMIEVTP